MLLLFLVLVEARLEHPFAHRHVAPDFDRVVPNSNLLQRELVKPSTKNKCHVSRSRCSERIHLGLGQEVAVRRMQRVRHSSCNRRQLFVLCLGNCNTKKDQKKKEREGK